MSENDVIRKLFTNVSFTPGYGDTGKRIEIVERDCDYCGYDRAYSETWVNPEFGEEIELSCTNPACPDHEIPAGLRSRN
jgi:hypothetical protein